MVIPIEQRYFPYVFFMFMLLFSFMQSDIINQSH